jgi:hypothetical protein
MLDIFILKKGRFSKNESRHEVRKDIERRTISIIRIPCIHRKIHVSFEVLPEVPRFLVFDL